VAVFSNTAAMALTFCSATGWNNPAMNIPSLSMATVNAASARGSMFQLQQPPCANPPPVDPRSLEIMGFDELGEDDYDDLALTEYEDLDPVQLHHQLSFGMSHPTNMSSTSTVRATFPPMCFPT
jgi:hypothetical protein